MREKLKNKYVLAALAAAAIFSVLLFNDSFRSTFRRKVAIQQAQVEFAQVEAEMAKVKAHLTSLENQPHVKEDLVRKELGYIKPGEKEIRFVQTQSKSR